MKNTIIALSIAAAGLAFSQAAGAADTMPKVQLNVIGNLGITTQYKELEAPFWTTVVPKATDGAVTATVKPWNEIGLKGPEVFRLLRQGTFDIGTTVMGFMAGDAPINDATDLAGLSPTIEDFRKATEAFRPVLESYYAKEQQIKVLGLWSYQAQVLYCRDELKGLADLKGRKIRTSGASQADFVGYFGASGIPMAFGEVQQSLQTGALDCAITGTLGGYKAKWYEGAKYLYPLPVNWASSIQGASMKSWSKLSPAEQTILVTEIRKLEQAIFDQNVRENDLGIRCNTGGACSEGPAAKMILVPVTEKDLELRREVLLKAVLPRWAHRCGAACVKSWNETVGKVVHLTAPVE